MIDALLLLAAVPDAPSFSAWDYAWLAAGIAIFAHVSNRIAREGGAVTQVAEYGAPEVWIAVFLAMLYFLPGLASYGPAESPRPPRSITAGDIGLSSGLVLGIVALVLSSLVRNGRTINGLFGLDRVPLWKAFVVGAILIFAAYPLLELGQRVTSQFGNGPEDLQELVKVFWSSRDTTLRFAIFLSAAIVAPIAEEIFFRGLIYGVAKRFGGLFSAALFNSALFAFIHGNIPNFGPLFVLALLLTLAYEYSGSLYVPMCMHALLNSSMLVRLLYEPDLPS